jgi:zinc transporter ZupT
MNIFGLFYAFAANNILLLGLFGGTVCALFNLVGAMPVLLFKQVPEKMLNTFLGFAAGIMLGASFTSLIIPATKIGGSHQYCSESCWGPLSSLLQISCCPTCT